MPYTVRESGGAVTYSVTTGDGMVQQLVRRHAVGITHWYAPSAHGQPIALYEGPFSLGGDAYHGGVQFVWTPRPTIAVTGQPTKVSDLSELLTIAEPATSPWVAPAEFQLPIPGVIPSQPKPVYIPDESGAGRMSTNVIVRKCLSCKGKSRLRQPISRHREEALRG